MATSGSRPPSQTCTSEAENVKQRVAQWYQFLRYIRLGRINRCKRDPLLGQVDNPGAWEKVSTTLLASDIAKIGRYSDDIDTLLVFAGLFSAVLAAFNIEAYRLLQRDPEDATLIILSQISQQLNSFSVNQQSVNSSFPTSSLYTPGVYQPSRAIIVVNTLWFLSLVFSLATASLGMMVKQWLREYLSYDSTSPEVIARLRFHRRNGLERWSVFEIAELLPKLLQLALAQFFVALSIFLSRYNTTLSIVIGIAIASWFSFYAVTIIGPILSSNCPYKSPFLKTTTRSVREFVRHHLQNFFRNKLLPTHFAPQSLPSEHRVETDPRKDGQIWVAADFDFVDDKFVKETIHMCVAEVEGPEVVRCVRSLANRRAIAFRKDPADLADYGQDSVSLALVNALTKEMGLQSEAGREIQWEPWMLEAFDLLVANWKYCSPDIGRHHLSDFLLAIVAQDWGISRHFLRYHTRDALQILRFGLVEWEVYRQYPNEWAHIIERIMQSVCTLLAHGPVVSNAINNSPIFPFDPMSQNLAIVVSALFFSISCASASNSVRDVASSTLPSTLGEVIRLADSLLGVLEVNYNADQIGHTRRCSATKEDWEDAISSHDKAVKAIKRSGLSLPSKWLSILRQLRDM